jgi:hypothetical protein
MQYATKFAAAFAILAFASASEEDHHDHGEPCGCVAEEQGWTVDCSDSAAIDTAWAALATEGCAASMEACEDKATDCAKNFAIVQAHHDHCDHDDVPQAVEQGYHTYEDVCKDNKCEIGRQYNANKAACPTVDCSDKVAQQAAVDALDANDCNTACTGDCATNFKLVVAFHDACEEDDLIDAIEHELHEFEESCEEEFCNSVSGPFDPMDVKCDHDDHGSGDDHGEDGSAGRAISNVLLVAAAAMIGASL